MFTKTQISLVMRATIINVSAVLLILASSCRKQDGAVPTSTQVEETLQANDNISQALIKDPEVLAYIAEQGHYLPLDAIANLPYNCVKYYPGIRNYMQVHVMQISDYYLDSEAVQETDSTITIPIYHYNGFVERKSIDEKNKLAASQSAAGENAAFIIVNGNLSGVDGNLDIYKNSGRITFGLWQ